VAETGVSCAIAKALGLVRRIVVNVCRDRMRRHRTLRMVELDEAAQVETPDTFAEMIETDRVAAAVARLSRTRGS